MSAGDPWHRPPPPRPPPTPTGERRYAIRTLLLGVGAAITVTGGSPLLALAVDPRLSSGLATALLLVIPLLPMALAVVLLVRPGTPSQHGLGLGLLVGWAVAPIILAGVCVTGLVTVYLPVGTVSVPDFLAP